ncbi:MAG: methionyl-tRNA formyltransferase [Cellvibrionales bacterium]|nr:methionyl-tRNA formyltransferase [Cellvibrionales bacterium]
MTYSLSIVFAGTPDFSADQLNALIQHQWDISAVYCQPDRPKGRGKKLLPPPTKALALEHNLPVYQPLNFRSQEAIDELAALKPDVMVVVAYGLLLPESVLSIPTYGCINVHASSLPRWRGAAPIERAIEAGDTETGVTIMQMDKGLDTGDMLLHESLPITSKTTGDSLRAAMSTLGADLLIKTLEHIASQQLKPIKQDDSLATYAKKIVKPETGIDWQQSCHAIDQKIRAFNSHYVCFTVLDNQRIKIWEAQPMDSPSSGEPGEILSIDKNGIVVACGEGQLSIQKIQLPGGKAINIQALLNGNKHLLTQGCRFE